MTNLEAMKNNISDIVSDEAMELLTTENMQKLLKRIANEIILYSGYVAPNLRVEVSFDLEEKFYV